MTYSPQEALPVTHLGRLLIFLTLVGLSAHASTPDCHAKVGAFLKSPNESGLAALSEPGAQDCWEVIDSSNPRLNELNHQVETGNRWAAQYLAKHLNRLDGGNLEDAEKVLGKFSEHETETLLSFTRSGILSNQELADALTMTPDSMVDDASKQLKCLEARRDKVTRVTRSELSAVRDFALGALGRAISEVKSHISGAN